LQIGPLGYLVALSVQLLMMIPAQRHGKLVNDFASEGAWLRELQVTGIRAGKPFPRPPGCCRADFAS